MTRISKIRILESEMQKVHQAISQSEDLSQRFYQMTYMVCLETRYKELTGRYYDARRRNKK